MMTEHDAAVKPKREKYKPTVRSSGVGTGTISLLMIFTVLCFATLAMLSLSTAASSQRIQERALESGRLLAVAKGEAATHIAQVDAHLLDTARQVEEQQAQAQREEAKRLAEEEAARAKAKSEAEEAVAADAEKSEGLEETEDPGEEYPVGLVIMAPGPAMPSAYYRAAATLMQGEGWAPSEAESQASGGKPIYALRLPLDENTELLTKIALVDMDDPAFAQQRYVVLEQVVVMTGGWAPEDTGAQLIGLD